MATRYVGAGGNDANDGLSWANRKLTLNGAEDSPVAAGDTVYVGPGAYRETLTVDVSGTAGNPITYIGDYTGANTDGVGGVVRITGSNDDITATRTRCIHAAAARSYRTFRGFTLEMASQDSVLWTDGSNVTFDKCVIMQTGANQVGLYFQGATQANHVVSNCFIEGIHPASYAMIFSHSSTVSDTGHVVSNCNVHASQYGVVSIRVGGVTVKNCTIRTPGSPGGGGSGVRVLTAVAVGQTVTVNNCIFWGCGTALIATTTGEIVENYNALFGCSTNRSNVSTGANSNAYPCMPDRRGLHELLNGGTLVSEYDLSSYSPLVELNSGTGAPSTDMRGASQTGTHREWGPLEYNAALLTEGGAAIALSPIGAGIIAAHWGGGQ